MQAQAVLPGATRTEISAPPGRNVDTLPAETVPEAGDLADAALLGLDRGETVSIPPPADGAQRTAHDGARRATAANPSRRDVAPRCRRAG